MVAADRKNAPGATAAAPARRPRRMNHRAIVCKRTLGVCCHNPCVAVDHRLVPKAKTKASAAPVRTSVSSRAQKKNTRTAHADMNAAANLAGKNALQG